MPTAFGWQKYLASQESSGSAEALVVDFDSVDRLRFNATETVINETGIDRNFRIEGDTLANLFFLDAGSDQAVFGSATVADTLAILSIVDDAAGATAVTLALQHDSASPADADEQQVRFYSTVEDAGNAAVELARITVVQEDATAATDDASIRFDIMVANVLLNDVFIIGPTSAAGAMQFIFNEDGDDADFRIEGDTNANMLVIDAATDSMSFGSAVVAGASYSVSNLTGRDFVTAVGHQLHIPSGSITDSGVTGTIGVLATEFVGAATVLATNTITYTDAASLRVLIPVASTGATFTRTYAIWTNGQVRADSNFQVNNTALFATTQPTAAVVFQSGTAPVGAITTGGALFASTTVIRKIIADGTASDVQT